MKTISLLLAIICIAGTAVHAQDTIPPPSGKKNSAVVRDKKDDNTLMTFDGVRATSRVSSKYIRKRNTGIGLTIAGLGLFGTGVALIATAPWTKRTNYYTNTTSYNTTPAGLAGILLIPISVGVTIPGTVLWGRYSSRIRRAQHTER